MYVTTSWDDGHPKDLRLAELLTKHGLPATFYIPISSSERAVMKSKDIRKISKKFEVGGHTLNHKDLTKISLKEAKKEIEGGKRRLEDIVGKKVVSFCYPKGKVNGDVKELVKSAGFSFARTIELFTTSLPDKLLAPTTVHAYSYNPILYLKKGIKKKLYYLLLSSGGLSSWDNVAKRALDYCNLHGGVYHLWGHSWEIDEGGEWDKLEQVFSYIANNTNKNFRFTNGELAKS